MTARRGGTDGVRDEDDGSRDQDRVRASAAEIYERVKVEGASELGRPVAALAFSGLFAGVSIGFGAAASAAASTVFAGQSDAHLIGDLFFPIGFILVIIGRAQLFTENTLYPVTLVLDERRHLVATLRLWSVVLIANLVGAALFALLLTKTSALPAQVVSGVIDNGRQATLGTAASFFWSAVLGGWIVALVAWLIQTSGVVIGQVVLIWALIFTVALLHLDHSVSTTIEVICATIRGEVAVGHAIGWFALVLLGNIAGGVLITAMLNYGQVRAGAKRES